MNGLNPVPSWREEDAVDEVRKLHQETIQLLEKLLAIVSKPITASRCAKEIKSMQEALAVLEGKFRKKREETDESEGTVSEY